VSSEKRISVFISYSRDSDEHGRWVAELADRLHQEQAIAIVFDDYDVRPGMSLTKFMERASEVDKILVVLTPSYKTKAESRTGGVGYEAGLLTTRLLTEATEATVVPVLRGPKEVSIPSFLKDKVYVDFRPSANAGVAYKFLVNAIKERPARERPASLRPGQILIDGDELATMSKGSRDREWSLEFELPNLEPGPPNRVLVIRLPTSGLTSYRLLLLLRDRPPLPLLAVDSHFIELAVEDFDADGRPEIAVLYHTGAHSRGFRLFRIELDLSVTPVPGADLGSDWPLIEWTDLNGDGKLELRKRDRNWSKVPVMDYIEETYGWQGLELKLLTTTYINHSESDP